MAIVRGEEGSVSFDNGSGSVTAVAGTTSWSLDMTKDVYETTSHGATSRTFGGGLKSATGTIEVQYTATSGDAVAELLADVNTSEDTADASFNLFYRCRCGFYCWRTYNSICKLSSKWTNYFCYIIYDSIKSTHH